MWLQEKGATIVYEYQLKERGCLLQFMIYLCSSCKIVYHTLQNILIFDSVTVFSYSYVWYIPVNELLLYIVLVAYEFITLQTVKF